jgi:hypothetical protein
MLIHTAVTTQTQSRALAEEGSINHKPIPPARVAIKTALRR